MLPDCLQRWWHVLQISEQGFLQAYAHLVCDGFRIILFAGNLSRGRQAHGNGCSARDLPGDGSLRPTEATKLLG